MDLMPKPEGRLYSIREAARLLGLEPSTLRAWERRHGLPRPRRAANGYRLYSEADLELLRRLKTRTEAGVRIGIAVEEGSASDGRVPSGHEPTSVKSFRNRLLQAILQTDERPASTAMREALVLHTVEDVLASIMEPVLTRIGDEWKEGRLPIGVEHFASSFFMRHLILLYAAAPLAWRSGLALAACHPGDRHEIGLMVVAVGLRRRGWDVRYLGADLPAPEVVRAALHLRPDVVLLSCTLAANGESLAGLGAQLRLLPGPAPDLILGGQAFLGHGGPPDGATVLEGGLNDMLGSLETILLRRTYARSVR
jgi:methanogenic corrinoid protein MtbC1